MPRRDFQKSKNLSLTTSKSAIKHNQKNCLDLQKYSFRLIYEVLPSSVESPTPSLDKVYQKGEKNQTRQNPDFYGQISSRSKTMINLTSKLK